LKLNADKTRVNLDWISTATHNVNISELQLQSSVVQFTNTVSDHVVMVDSQLKMSAHVTAVSRSCMFQLRQLRAVRHSLFTDAAKTLVIALSSSRLDYCNSLFAGVTSGLMTKLLSVQNAAARFTSKSCTSCQSVDVLISRWHTRPQVSPRSRATVSHRLLLTRILVVWSVALTVCRHAQAVRPEDVHELLVAIFRCFLTQL